MQKTMCACNGSVDYVIATGEQFTVRTFIEWSAAALGITLKFEGSGVDEKGIISHIEPGTETELKVGDVIVQIDPRFFRPAEVETLLGDPSKAKNDLGWVPEISTKEMCEEMVREDLVSAKRMKLLKTQVTVQSI